MIAPLDPVEYREIVRRALEEDLGDGDVTTQAIVLPTQRARGVFIAKTDCVVAGLDVVTEVFHQLESNVQLTANHQDGDRCATGDTVAEVTGSARALIMGERTALNFLQRLSGIATSAQRFVAASGGRITILDTRKTTPNLRVLEKYAVRAGGATNHRRGLFDRILIKDNHIRLAGGVKAAVERARAFRPGLPVEIEAQSLQQVDEALAAGAETILIDNMSDDEIRSAVAQVKGQAHIEVSGGIRLERIPKLAETGADFVSVGALTHSAAAVDISFEIEPVSPPH
ncbi:MAG TPA: carboxylating nicotinate-nucleotide diphosphorylase [Vicinamibacterales bacterium]|nr:carboxylating nicotinate-nucleotide diphosphorylase [Vicinamibacterales bacterium]